MNPLIERRLYEEYVQCDVCLSSTTDCIFYQCVCTHTQIKICWLCSFHSIKLCEICTEDEEEEINFYQYF